MWRMNDWQNILLALGVKALFIAPWISLIYKKNILKYFMEIIQIF